MSFDALPPEIINSICELLSTRDLRSARLAASIFDYATGRVLFRTIYLRATLSELNRAMGISRHKTLRRHVQTITYEGRGIDEAKELVAAILEGFPNLLALVHPEMMAPALCDRPRTEQLSDGHFWEMLGIAMGSRGLKEICAGNISAQAFSDFVTSSSPANVAWNFSRLHHLNLQFADNAFKDRFFTQPLIEFKEAHIPAFLSLFRQATQLRSLTLAFGGTRTIYPDWDEALPHFRVHSLLETGFSFAHLTKLSLRLMAVAPAALRGLLARHSPTLRTLVLSDFSLRPAATTQKHADDYQWPNPNTYEAEDGQWFKMVQWMRDHLSLQQVELSGYLATDPTEIWVADPTARADGLCNRIQMYITRRGPAPFERRVPEVEARGDGTWHPSNSWNYNEDGTWHAWDLAGIREAYYNE